jgi:hypothetical protein
MAKKPTQSEKIEALTDYIGEVSCGVDDLINALMDHMAPDVQRAMHQIKRDLSTAGRDLSNALDPKVE